MSKADNRELRVIASNKVNFSYNDFQKLNQQIQTGSCPDVWTGGRIKFDDSAVIAFVGYVGADPVGTCYVSARDFRNQRCVVLDTKLEIIELSTFGVVADTALEYYNYPCQLNTFEIRGGFIRPDYRGRRLFSQLYDACHRFLLTITKDSDFVFVDSEDNIASSDGMMVCSASMGYYETKDLFDNFKFGTRLTRFDLGELGIRFEHIGVTRPESRASEYVIRRWGLSPVCCSYANLGVIYARRLL